MHRVRQLVAHLTARVRPGEEDEVRRVLHGDAWRLYAAMPVADRRHALDVVARLRAGGHADADVVTAALLHDAAKGHRMRLWHRVAGVLLDAAVPGLLRRLASPDPGSRRHPFHLYLHHGRLSAEMAAAAGVSPRAVALIRGDEVGAIDVPLMRALQAADDAS